MNFRKKITISFCILFFYYSKVKAQYVLVSDIKPNLGISVGANLAFGTHFQRAGLVLNFYVLQNQLQANSELRLYYNFKSLGPKLSYPELVLSQAVVFAYGAKQSTISTFVNSISNQTNFQNAIVYCYNAYFNREKTSQQTGIISLQFNQFSVSSENDLLARPSLDRFRTAAILFQYQYNNQFQFGVNCTLWTGQYGWKKFSDNAHFKQGCYLDTTNGVYTNYSHGLLSFQAKYHNLYYQTLQSSIGYDSEKIRNVIQNKFIHDMPFLPKGIKNNNCHIPMLDENGNPYLYLENQKIKRGNMYLNVFSNASVFY